MNRRLRQGVVLVAWVGGLSVACAPKTASEVDVSADPLITGTALFVVGSTSLGAGDAAIRSRLQAVGLTVTVRSPGDTSTGWDSTPGF